MSNLETYSALHKHFSEISFSKLTEKDLKFLKKLKKLGINSIYDLLYYFPRGYDNRTNLKNIADIKDNEYVVIKGEVAAMNSSYSPTKKSIVRASVFDSSGAIELTWFSPYVAKVLKPGNEYYFIGTAKHSNYGIKIVNPEFKLVSAQNSNFYDGEILPIYSTSMDITQNMLRKYIKIFFNEFSKIFLENIPYEILSKYNLMNRILALKNIHFPSDEKSLESAKRRFAVEELLLLEMGILSSRYSVDAANHALYTLEDKKEYVKKFLSSLNFKLTNSQKKIITEIHKELSQGKIVNRLIQGDVGSGKTIVSMILLLYMAENSYQGAIMAPTEILATQHYLSHKKDFENLGLKVELLTGSLTAKKKNQIILDIQNGDIDIVIGTHALIQDSVQFKKLGLIVIDEQHRFGVEQRKLIRDKGVLANLIVMSATPIPRSLALSIYGDLDLSIINELPPGRKSIKTKHLNSESDIKKMYTFINKKLLEGRQAYFIVPLIEESEKSSLKSVMELYEEVENNLKGFKVGILHGKLSSKDKDNVMSDFKNGIIDIIVSTTVVEVGVNVPNASIIVINNSERFGLSSLHQLRGRVGRGEHQSYCFLVSDTKNETSIARMDIMELTNDGFKIAEEDLKLRKPGEIFGVRQSGVTDFKFIDIIHDVKTIKLVRDECIEYLKNNNGRIEEFPLAVDIKNKFTIETS